jgi:hypothetical protein
MVASGSKEKDAEEDETFLRSLVPCEEDRRNYGRPPYRRGEWRWFRSTNVVPIEEGVHEC